MRRQNLIQIEVYVTENDGNYPPRVAPPRVASLPTTSPGPFPTAITAQPQGIELPPLEKARKSERRWIAATRLRKINSNAVEYINSNKPYPGLEDLVCPTDPAPRVADNHSSTNYHPADQAPRSYCFNGFNDRYRDLLNWQIDVTFTLSVRKIPAPSDTAVLSERQTEVDTGNDFYIDILDRQGDILYNAEESRHSTASNVGFADGSAHRMERGTTTYPEVLWASDRAMRNELSQRWSGDE